MAEQTDLNGVDLAVEEEVALFAEIEFLAFKAFAEGTRKVNERLHGLGLRARSYSVLAVACSPRPMTQRALAELLELDPSQIVSLVDGLVDRGLVTRDTDPEDRRYRIVRAGAEGRELFARAREVTRRAEDEALALLASDERETLRTLLRKIVLRP